MERYLAKLVSETLDIESFKDAIYRDKYLKVASNIESNFNSSEKVSRKKAYFDSAVIVTVTIAIILLIILGFNVWLI